MTKKILLTGANGLLGQKLVHLIGGNSGYQLIGTGKGENRLSAQYSNYQYDTMDITNGEEVLEVFAKHKPDFVIHAAAQTNVDHCEINKIECWSSNVLATQNIVNACLAQKSFLLHISTDFIFDGTAGPYKEDAVPYPLSFYGYSKLVAEEIVQKAENLTWAIARTVLVYGIAEDMSRSNIILWVKKSLEDGKRINVVDDQFRTPTLAEDLAKGCFLIVDQKATGIFNISGSDFLTPLEMAYKTADYFKLDKNLITKADSTTFVQPAKRPPRTGFDITKAKNILGYQPVTFDEGIAFLAKQLK